MGRRVGSKEHNCQSEHDTPVDRPHCDSRTTHYENRAGVSLKLVPTRARVHETFIFLPGDRSLSYSRMIYLALLPHNTKQHANHLLRPPTRYAAGGARFLPCAHIYPSPCFSATRVGRGAAKMRLACRGARCSSTWHRDHSSCIAVSQHPRWLGRQVCSQVIGQEDCLWQAFSSYKG